MAKAKTARRALDSFVAKHINKTIRRESPEFVGFPVAIEAFNMFPSLSVCVV